MKNKHLVLIFMLVLFSGLVFRQWPFGKRNTLTADLLRLDSAGVEKIDLFIPGKSPLFLERTPEGWMAERQGRVGEVAPDKIASALSLLCGPMVLHTLKTTRPDTLGLSDAAAWEVRTRQEGSDREQRFWLGREAPGPGYTRTYLRLEEHGVYYLAPGALRRLLLRPFFQAGDVRVAPWPLHELTGMQAALSPDSIFRWPALLRDSLWQDTVTQNPLNQNTAKSWLAVWKNLPPLPYADYFDDHLPGITRLLVLDLTFAGGRQESLTLFHIMPPEAPEDLETLRSRVLSPYVLKTSAHPDDYFAIPDSIALQLLNF